VKRAGTNADGTDKWPDLGDGDVIQKYGWIEEKYMSIDDDILLLKLVYSREHREQDQRGANEVEGENRCSWCNRCISNGYLQKHREKVGKKACPMKPRVLSYANTHVDKLVQRKKGQR
jgi:hypothetical protein